MNFVDKKKILMSKYIHLKRVLLFRAMQSIFQVR